MIDIAFQIEYRTRSENDETRVLKTFAPKLQIVSFLYVIVYI